MMASIWGGTPPEPDEARTVATIRERYTKFMQGGQFIAESELCDEDGTQCPTGRVGFLGAPNYGDPDDDPYSPSIIAFQDTEDAPAFVEILADHAALLALIETMRAETDRLAAECARLTPANILAGIRANETIAAQDNEIVELRSQLQAADEWNAGLSAALERRPAQGVNDGAAQDED